MSECKACGASWPLDGQVCLYCGSEIPERVEQTAVQAKMQQDQFLQLWQDLGTLHAMPTPRPRDAVVKVLWWYLILGTLGILYLFWKNPNRNGFNQEAYDTIMQNLRRNTRVAELSCAATDQHRLDAVRAETARIDTFVAAARRRNVKVMVVAVVVLAALGIIAG